MRLVIQRVSQAELCIEEKIFSSIGQGLVVLLGYEDADTLEDVEWAMQKLINLRIFSDDEGKMNLSIQDVRGECLLVSQFTLHASTKKGNRPSFIKAAKPHYANELYHKTIQYASALLPDKIKTGVFGADMKISLTNDGPVTIVIDTKNKE